MLGQIVSDPHGVEGKSGDSDALGLLDITTELTKEKRLQQVAGTCAFGDMPAAKVSGYEIHMGVTYASSDTLPAFIVDGEEEGTRSPDDLILGTYLHGLFDHPEACKAILQWAGLESEVTVDLNALREQSIDRVADACIPLLQALKKLP
jgi:adenosylcobyric acid synthase